MTMETQRILQKSLAVVVVIAAVIWTTTAEYLKADVQNSCCTKVLTSEVTDPIISFRMQNERLPCVKAVMKESQFLSKENMSRLEINSIFSYISVFNLFILFDSFETERGYFCSDWRQTWVTRKILQFLKDKPKNRFYTEKDKFCSDPKARWFQEHLKGLKEIVD
ncbi:eotaxin-like isoform X1 [Labeo rohita]|uniref:Eotaxin-like isoform X1 n=1 Tax=Labeo rohita TaxID=84645 RepID=A0A498LTY0_LABRO|nr:eotaxin-like isoform X1 [Labeo rohita]